MLQTLKVNSIGYRCDQESRFLILADKLVLLKNLDGFGRLTELFYSLNEEEIEDRD